LAIGDRIKKVRTRKGLTQIELAELAGVKQARISALERNLDTKTKYLVEIAGALGVDPNWLNSGLGDETPTISSDDLTSVEQEILRLLRNLNPDEREREIAYLQKLSSKKSVI